MTPQHPDDARGHSLGFTFDLDLPADSPLGGRMRGHIAVENASRADLEYNEYIKDAEAGGDRNHEVASDQGMRMIAHERVPMA